MNWIPSVAAVGFSANPGWIHQGRNSGYQLLNLIVLFGAARVLLLGYDMRAAGKRHWHRDHDRGLHNPDDALLADFARRYDSIQPLTCDVLNCTPDSAVRRFPMAELRSVE